MGAAPQDGDAWLGLCLALERLGDRSGGREAFGKASALGADLGILDDPEPAPVPGKRAITPETLGRLAPVGQHTAIGRYGNLDMAGNVREWIMNETAEGMRFLAGGGWDDPEYDFTDLTPTAAPPFDRARANGFRLAEFLDSANLDRAREPVTRSRPTYGPEDRPVSDEIFSLYKRLYDYDRIPLDPQVVEADTARDWVREKVTLNASFMDERVSVYVYVPKTGRPPFQAVVYWPGANAISLESIDGYRGFNIDFVVRSGRALIFPVLTGTFERRSRGPISPIGTVVS